VTAKLSAARAKAGAELHHSLPRLARYDRVAPRSASWPLMGPQGAAATVPVQPKPEPVGSRAWPGLRRSSATTDQTLPVDATQRVIFGPEADGFAEVLRSLCHQTPAVTITLHSDERFGAVLLSVDDGVLIYGHWDDAAGLPSGEPGTVNIEEISEVRVK